MLKCYECSFQAENAKGLSYHVRIRHGKAYPDYLVEHERGGVWPTCGCGCGQKVRFLCGQFCAHVGSHAQVGKSKSELHRQHISEAQRGISKSEASNAKRSAAMLDYHSKHNNVRVADKKYLVGSKRTEESKRKQGATRRAMFASGELKINRAAISKRITQLYLEGGFHWSTGTYVSSKTGKTIHYRSSWELEYAQLLDMDDTVVTWQYEPFAISYEHNGETKQYLPDFLVSYDDGTKELVEVKPERLMITSMNEAKRKAALALCETAGWSYASWNAT